MSMSQEDVCDTGLALGLGHGGRSTTATSHVHSHHRQKPSLTLSLSDDTHRPATAHLSSPHSIVSSFCPIKREKDMMMEEVEMEEEDDGSARKKLRLTKEQSSLLEDRFKEHSTLNPKQKQALAKQLNLRPRQVEVWFQNRRARTKLKQTEVDCEFLKRCCETLSDENRRLQKELQELRELKSVHPPLYMPATLTMCPSCERIGGRGDSTKGAAAGGGGGGGGHFVVATSKPRFFNPFTHPAAC